jgi:hypothetical protein
MRRIDADNTNKEKMAYLCKNSRSQLKTWFQSLRNNLEIVQNIVSSENAIKANTRGTKYLTRKTTITVTS